VTINAAGTDGRWKGGAPVFGTSFEFEWGGRRWAYPDVWLSEQVEEPSPLSTGRRSTGHYTPDSDPTGMQALQYGDRYYYEGMSCEGDELRARRIGCFQAAELLYLHAAEAGNPLAHLRLGRVYAYDRCEGGYWDRLMSWEPGADAHEPFPCDRQAYKQYLLAAQAGVAEACCGLGDMLRDGRGCEADHARAYFWYARAYELGASERPAVWGCAALRLGEACERGEGCERSLEQAATWYMRACEGLREAVRAG